jgi:SAM-dependent methyltransferase
MHAHPFFLFIGGKEMNATTGNLKHENSRLSPLHAKGAFSRQDEADDAFFYATDRFVSHIDSEARQTIERLIGTLIVEEGAAIMDLMAGWDSHIPKAIKAARVVGLGLNESELKQNPALTEYVIHDLNKEPRLPFEDNTFDVIINTVSVDYMTKPIEVFQDVGRVLKPGGLFLVAFSNRMFPQKAVRVWREAGEDERVLLVEELFKRAGAFEGTTLFVSKGKPRPNDDKYAAFGIPSDPVYAVYADKSGGSPLRKRRPSVTMFCDSCGDESSLSMRKKAIKDTLACPHCGERLRKWAVPDNPFGQTWDNDFMYICFNDACPYYVKGWDHMYKEGNRGVSYRLMYNPEKDCCMPIPVPSPKALRESIVE